MLELEQEDREVVHLKYMVGFAYEEISAMVGRTERDCAPACIGFAKRWPCSSNAAWGGPIMSESNPKWVNDLKKVHDQLAIDESFKAELRCKLVQEGLTFEQTSRRNRDNDGSRSEGGPHIQAGAGAEHSSMMILDGNGERAVMDVTREDNRADIAILSIDGADMAPVYLYDKLQGPNYEEMGTRLWDGSMLSFYIAVDGRDFFFKYNAAQ